MWYFEKTALLPPKNKFIKSGFQRRNVTLEFVTKASEGFCYILCTVVPTQVGKNAR